MQKVFEKRAAYKTTVAPVTGGVSKPVPITTPAASLFQVAVTKSASETVPAKESIPAPVTSYAVPVANVQSRFVTAQTCGDEENLNGWQLVIH